MTKREQQQAVAAVAGVKRYAKKVDRLYEARVIPRNMTTARAIDAITQAVRDLEREMVEGVR